jgi:hypothetical protein
MHPTIASTTTMIEMVFAFALGTFVTGIAFVHVGWHLRLWWRVYASRRSTAPDVEIVRLPPGYWFWLIHSVLFTLVSLFVLRATILKFFPQPLE